MFCASNEVSVKAFEEYAVRQALLLVYALEKNSDTSYDDIRVPSVLGPHGAWGIAHSEVNKLIGGTWN
jgi:hypothetical protein